DPRSGQISLAHADAAFAGSLTGLSNPRHRGGRGREAVAGCPVAGGSVMAAADSADIRLIDPSVKDLATALKKAHQVANRGVTYARSEKLDRDIDFWGRFARDCMREPAGRRRSCKAGYQTPEVIAGWWTDPAGRRHFRVLGRTRSRYGRIRAEGELRG